MAQCPYLLQNEVTKYNTAHGINIFIFIIILVQNTKTSIFKVTLKICKKLRASQMSLS